MVELPHWATARWPAGAVDGYDAEAFALTRERPAHEVSPHRAPGQEIADLRPEALEVDLAGRLDHRDLGGLAQLARSPQSAVVKFFPGDAASNVLDLGCGEPAVAVFVYGLPEQTPDQRGGGNVLGGGSPAQLRV